MSKVTAFITDGTEEAECIIAVDLLRRAGIETELVSCSGSREILTSHRLRITADKTFEKKFGRPADRRRKLYNGRIETCYYQYHGKK